MQPKNSVAIKKRSQITVANRTMFLWVAGSSVILGFALVVIIFLVQMALFNVRVLNVKIDTYNTLKQNYSNITPLKNAVRVLDTNSDLASVKTDVDTQTVQVVLDALPSDANSLALGASIQNKLLANIPGLSLDSLQVEPVAGIESISDTGTVDASYTTTQDNEINFTFSATGNAESFKKALLNIESSIRAIDIISLKIESQNSNQVMTVHARAFYEPAVNFALKDKVVK